MPALPSPGRRRRSRPRRPAAPLPPDPPAADDAEPDWVPNTARCMLCDARFSLLRRRHHCRGCGRVVCGACSGHRRPLRGFGYDTPVRVCDPCVADSTPARPEHALVVRTKAFERSGSSTRRLQRLPSMVEREEWITVARGVSLEARVSGGAPDAPVVVLMHPYGTLGGSMHNSVVQALASHLQRAGYATCRFNFRGVGGSTSRGTFRARGEVADAVRVCEHLCRGAGAGRAVVLVGFSFGAAVAAAVADRLPAVRAFAALAYPFSVLWAVTLFHHRSFRAQAHSAKPKLFLAGDADKYTPVDAFLSCCAELPEPKRVVVVPGADHYFVNDEARLVEEVGGWVGSLDLGGAGGGVGVGVGVGGGGVDGVGELGDAVRVETETVVFRVRSASGEEDSLDGAAGAAGATAAAE